MILFFAILPAAQTWAGPDPLIDDTAAGKGYLVIIVHKIEEITDNTEMQFPPASFEKIVECIQANKDSL